MSLIKSEILTRSGTCWTIRHVAQTMAFELLFVSCQALLADQVYCTSGAIYGSMSGNDDAVNTNIVAQ